MLQTLTLSYPDRHHFGPKVQVLFTNISKFKYDDDEEEDAESFASESGDDNSKVEKNEGEEVKS